MQICRFLHLHQGTVSRAINSWYQMIQEDLTEDDCRIGGDGIIAEIDESNFGKYSTIVEGVWVVGGVELTPQRKRFLIVVLNRTAATYMI